MEGDRSARSLIEVRRLVATVLEELDAIDALVFDLQISIDIEDPRRAIDIRVRLHETWTRSLDTIAQLERVSGRAELFAREVVRRSQERARNSIEQMWTLIVRLQDRH